MRVGAVSETVTVTGESPLIDTQSVTQKKSLTHDVIDGLPTGRSFQNLSVLVPGVQTTLASPGRRRHGRRPLPDAVGARQPRRIRCRWS